MDVLHLLLQRGANVNALMMDDGESWCPVTRTIFCNEPLLLSILLSHGGPASAQSTASPSEDTTFTALGLAVKGVRAGDSLAMLRILLLNEADVGAESMV